MNAQNLTIYLAIVAFILGLLAHAIKLTWRISQMELDIREDVDANVDNIQRDVRKLEAETVEAHRREVGETVSAIRQKIHDVETWNRDTFVRKETFEQVIGRIEKSLDKLGDRFEEKMDRLIERLGK